MNFAFNTKACFGDPIASGMMLWCSSSMAFSTQGFGNTHSASKSTVS